MPQSLLLYLGCLIGSAETLRFGRRKDFSCEWLELARSDNYCVGSFQLDAFRDRLVSYGLICRTFCLDSFRNV